MLPFLIGLLAIFLIISLPIGTDFLVERFVPYYRKGEGFAVTGLITRFFRGILWLAAIPLVIGIVGAIYTTGIYILSLTGS